MIALKRYTGTGRTATEAEVRATILGHVLAEWLPDLKADAPEDAEYWDGPWSAYSWATHCEECAAVAAFDVSDDDFEGPIGRAVEAWCPGYVSWPV